MIVDADPNFLDSDLSQVGGNELITKLNGGGAKFIIVTVSGNICGREYKSLSERQSLSEVYSLSLVRKVATSLHTL